MFNLDVEWQARLGECGVASCRSDPGLKAELAEGRIAQVGVTIETLGMMAGTARHLKSDPPVGNKAIVRYF